MKPINKETVDRIALAASLQRLGVVELDERLEFSPLLVESGLQDTPGEAQVACCSCKIPKPADLSPRPPEIFNPWVGDGSTGPTSGMLHW